MEVIVLGRRDDDGVLAQFEHQVLGLRLGTLEEPEGGGLYLFLGLEEFTAVGVPISTYCARALHHDCEFARENFNIIVNQNGRHDARVNTLGAGKLHREHAGVDGCGEERCVANTNNRDDDDEEEAAEKWPKKTSKESEESDFKVFLFNKGKIKFTEKLHVHLAFEDVDGFVKLVLG